MQTSPVRLIDYFDGTKQSVIPLFQRRYSWTKKNWEGLWNDILELMDGSVSQTHFMGAIVSVPAHTVPVGVNKHLIIDGQQRLTTISILLCALREKLGERSEARVKDFLVNRHFEGPDHLKLLPTQGDREAYLSLVDQSEGNHSDHLMIKAFQYFRRCLRVEVEDSGEPVDAEGVLATIEKNLRVVMINLDEADDPYIIFESLNYRGEPLTHADLVRNFILMKFKNQMGTGGEQERVYHTLWVPMEQGLKDKLSTFLMHYGRKNGTEVRKNTIYSSFKSRMDAFQDAGEIEREVRTMADNARFYERFLTPSKEPSSLLRKNLASLEALDVSSCYPLLLNLYAALEAEQATEGEVAKCLDLIESYLVRRSACGLPNNAIDQLFVQTAGQLDPATVLLSVTNALAGANGRMRWPSDAEFVQALMSAQQYGKKSTPYILRKLEQAVAHKEMPDLTNTQIEHVLPQSMTDAWRAQLGPNAQDVYDRLVHTLGNLTLTGYNPELSNDTFERKREIYSDSNVDLNKWIARQPQWTENTIMERAEMLAAKCLEIWPR